MKYADERISEMKSIRASNKLTNRPRWLATGDGCNSELELHPSGRPEDMIRERGIDYLFINLSGRYRTPDKLVFSKKVMSSF